MARDYSSADFNAYDGGVGALMQSARNGGKGGGMGELPSGDINLFITNIPKDLTRVCRPVCLCYVVLYFTLLPPSPPRMASESCSLVLGRSRRLTLSSSSLLTSQPPMGESQLLPPTLQHHFYIHKC